MQCLPAPPYLRFQIRIQILKKCIFRKILNPIVSSRFSIENASIIQYWSPIEQYFMIWHLDLGNFRLNWLDWSSFSTFYFFNPPSLPPRCVPYVYEKRNVKFEGNRSTVARLSSRLNLLWDWPWFWEVLLQLESLHMRLKIKVFLGWSLNSRPVSFLYSFSPSLNPLGPINGLNIEKIENYPHVCEERERALEMD